MKPKDHIRSGIAQRSLGQQVSLLKYCDDTYLYTQAQTHIKFTPKRECLQKLGVLTDKKVCQYRCSSCSKYTTWVLAVVSRSGCMKEEQGEQWVPSLSCVGGKPFLCSAYPRCNAPLVLVT